MIPREASKLEKSIKKSWVCLVIRAVIIIIIIIRCAVYMAGEVRR